MGSRKGRPNRLTASVRDRIEQAFNAVNGDGNSGLIRLAEEHPAIFYSLVSKLVPVQATLAVSVVALNLGHEMAIAADNLAKLNRHNDMQTIEAIEAKPLETKD